MTITLIAESDIRTSVSAALKRLQTKIRKLAPNARIEHIGATAVPGSITKGDLDILVLVDPDDFSATKKRLEACFAVNQGSEITGQFAAFEGRDQRVDFGIQLTTPDNHAYNFLEWRDALLASAALVRRYNEIKSANASGSIDQYREAKARFIEETLGLAD